MEQVLEKIGVIGLGYVGLPLAAEFAKYFEVIGFDLKAERVDELNRGEDSTDELTSEQLASEKLTFTSDPDDLASCTFLVVAVPTPINKAREPDLFCLESASKTVGRILRKGMMVVYESTVYPGVTEEICCEILEKESGLKRGDFDLGYSPERVNPGDKEHTIDKIVKIVSGHSPEALARASKTYGRIITAGIHEAPTIKTAESAKVIENVQRDLNIALMNELSRIFTKMNINTKDVLAAAGTKWNFHGYHPGLVGGHCIGVDPYYLTHRALELGYHPEVILAGRRINDSMGYYVGELVIRELNAAGVLPSQAHVWVLGLTFKENVPDLRNTRSIDVIRYLQSFGVKVSAWEPLVPDEEVKRRFELDTLTFDKAQDLDAVVMINAHDEFKAYDLATLKTRLKTPILMDVKNVFKPEDAEAEGYRYLCL